MAAVRHHTAGMAGNVQPSADRQSLHKSLSNRAGTSRHERNSSPSCAKDCSTFLEPSLPTSWPAMRPPEPSFCPTSNTFQRSDPTIAPRIHQPTRERERHMRRFKSAGHAQRFLATFSVIASLFRSGRYLTVASNYREIMRRRFEECDKVTQSNFAFP